MNKQGKKRINEPAFPLFKIQTITSRLTFGTLPACRQALRLAQGNSSVQCHSMTVIR